MYWYVLITSSDLFSRFSPVNTHHVSIWWLRGTAPARGAGCHHHDVEDVGAGQDEERLGWNGHCNRRAGYGQREITNLTFPTWVLSVVQLSCFQQMAHLQMMHTKMGKPTSYWGTQFVVNPKSIPDTWQSINFVTWAMLLKPGCLVVLWRLQYLCTSHCSYGGLLSPLCELLNLTQFAATTYSGAQQLYNKRFRVI